MKIKDQTSITSLASTFLSALKKWKKVFRYCTKVLDIIYSHVDVVLQDGRDLSRNLRLEPLDEGLAVTVHKSEVKIENHDIIGV